MHKKNGLSQHLKTLPAESLRMEIRELHKLFPAVREYYQVKFIDGGEEGLLAKYKNIIKDEFSTDYSFGQARLSVARKAVNDFVKLSKKSINVADIMLFYVEVGVEFTNEFGDINEGFYSSMENMYEKTSQYVIKHNLQNIFIDRFKKIVYDTSSIGWGFNDALGDIFYQYFSKTGAGINELTD